MLLKHPSISVNQRAGGEEEGLFTPLQLACEAGNLEIVRLLLSHADLDVNIQDTKGVGTLLRLILRVTRPNQFAAIHICAWNDSADILALLLEHPQVFPNLANGKGV